MNDLLQEALQDYFKHKDCVDLDLQPDGLYTPPADNTCPLCAQARWSCNTGAHLKQPEHYALKYGLDVKLFMRACSPLAFAPSSTAWKALKYIENSYLVSPQQCGCKWLPNEVTYAECGYCEDSLPGKECSCGLYLFWSPFDAQAYLSGSVVVKCEIGGTIVEATKGCRAQCAVIRGIYHENGSERAQFLSEMYEVPLVGFMEDYDVRIDDLQ